MKKSIPAGIMNYLKVRGWTSGGNLEHDISARLVCKPSTASRRARELAAEGKIERNLIKLRNVSAKVVYYRYNRRTAI